LPDQTSHPWQGLLNWYNWCFFSYMYYIKFDRSTSNPWQGVLNTTFVFFLLY